MTGQNKTFRGKRHDGTANPIDVYVGSRIQKLRIAKGWSQSKLASLLGITFQQIQKYEKGLNRISASRLWYTAQLMNFSVDYFFKDISADLWKESFKLLPPAWKELDTAVRKPDPSFFQTADFYIPSRPVRFSAGSRPPPKTLLLKETFSQLQFIVSTGVSITKQIRHMQYGKSPLTTDVLRLQRIRTKPLCQTIVSP